jgi:hypothetical protein
MDRLDDLAYALAAGARARLAALRTAARTLFGGDGEQAPDGLGPVAASFTASLSDPRFLLQHYGFGNVRIDVRTGTLTVVPLPVEILVHGSWPPLEYAWPSVVLARLRPSRLTALLVELGGSLAYCEVREGTRFREALSTAGFEVVDIQRWLTSRPRPVRRDEVGDRFDRVPDFARAR